MKELFIDVSESYAWEGKVTGIIRVMDELSNRFFADQNTKTIFVIWNEEYESFCEINYRDILQRRGDIDQSEANKASIAAATLPNRMSVKLPLSRTARKLVNYPKARLNRSNIRPKNLVEINANAILFMPHGGVWGSKTYASKVLHLSQEKGIKLVPILYDLCPVISPQFCSPGIRKIFNSYMRKVLVGTDLVLAISQNTADDAQAWIASVGLGTIQKIEVFRLGDEIGGGVTEKPNRVALPDEYVLCVGTIEARKNHTSLYYAYKLAQEKGIKLPPLVIAGRKGWLAEDIYEIMTVDPSMKGQFIFLHDANDEELAWLYENAMFSVYPSFYEGWGLPVAESLLRGTPCVASNTSSISEIAGDLIDYFSPYSPEEIVEKISALSGDAKLLQEKHKKVVENYKATSWDDAYQEVFAALGKL